MICKNCGSSRLVIYCTVGMTVRLDIIHSDESGEIDFSSAVMIHNIEDGDFKGDFDVSCRACLKSGRDTGYIVDDNLNIVGC